MPQPSPAQQALAVFDVAGVSCAVPLSSISEVIHLPRLNQPPRMPAILLGFLNLAGAAVPVVRLDRLFGLAESANSLFTPLIILRASSAVLALKVDRMLGVQALPASGGALKFAQRDTLNGCVDATFESAGAVIHVLSVDRLLLEKERRCLAALKSEEEQRLKAFLPHAPQLKTVDAQAGAQQ